MGIKEVTVTTITCDRDGGEIDGDYVDATPYGIVLHTTCWEDMNGPEVAQTLGLDDIMRRNQGGVAITGTVFGRRQPPSAVR